MKSLLKIKFNVLLFYISYTLILFNFMFRQVKGISFILNFASQLGIGILIFICFMNLNKITKKTALILFITVVLALITRIVSGTNTILMMCLLIIACKNIKLESVIKYDLKIKILFLIIVSILYFLNLTNVNLHYRNGVVRHSMGFSNPNVFSNYILSITVEYLYLRKDKIKIKDIVVILISILVIDYYADSRTQILCLIVLAIILFLNKYTKKKFINNKINNFIIKNLFLILTIISLMLVYFYNQGSPLVYSINEQTSGRVRRIAEVMDQYDINLIGNKLNLVTSMQAKLTGEEQVALDNVYIYILLSYGIITFIYLCIAINKFIKYTIIEKEDILRVIILIFLIGGLMERFFVEIQINIFLLYFSHMIYNNKQKLENMENKTGIGE